MEQKPLTQSRLRGAMNLNIMAGTGGAVWATVCSPQAIFNIFFKNKLGATSGQLGILVAVIQLAAILNLVSIIVYSQLRRRKVLWISSSIVHRLFGVVLAVVAFTVSRGADPGPGIRAIFIGMTMSFVLANLSASGWWGWVADLFPEKIRASFFGRRSSIINGINMAWFFLVTVLLDVFKEGNVFRVYAIIFMIATVAGVMDMVLHIFIPETPAPHKAGFSLRAFTEPIRNRNFLVFSFFIGLMLFSINIFAPFAAPYITNPSAINAPNTWIGIMFVISQLTWMAVVPSWGLVMDRYGRKPVVVIGGLFTMSWIGYFFLSSGNYIYLLPLMSLVGGLLAPAFYEGVNQMMLTLTPQKQRIAYVSWYLTIAGVVSSGGSYVGGLLFDALSGRHLSLTPNLRLNNFDVVLAISLVLIGTSILVLRGIREGKQKPIGFVIASLARPGIFRTFINMGVISGSSPSQRIARALRSVEGSGHHIALEDVMSRLEDPDPDVREEAARALGRIGSSEAVTALVEQLRNESSSIRTQAARALGNIGDPRAIPSLIEGLSDSSEDLQEASAYALGSIATDESTSHLLRLFKETRSERVVASGADAASRLGLLEAAWEILPRMHETGNPVLRRQLAIALGNLLGRPGEFYRFVTGGERQVSVLANKLFQETRQNLALLTKAGPTETPVEDLRAIRQAFNDEEYEHALQLSITKAMMVFEMLLGAGSMPSSPTKARQQTGARREAEGSGAAAAEVDLVEHAIRRDVRLGLIVWFFHEVGQALEKLDETACRYDVLLGMYFLSTFDFRSYLPRPGPRKKPDPPAGTR